MAPAGEGIVMTRCLLGRHQWTARITQGGQFVSLTCAKCRAGPELAPITPPKVDDVPWRRPASVLCDAWAGKEFTETVKIDTGELLALAARLVGYAVPAGQDPRRLLDTLALAALDEADGPA